MKIDPKYHYRTGTHCWYCNREYAVNKSLYYAGGGAFPLQRTKDHIISRFWGGINNERNYIGCCVDCNGLKGMKKLKGFIAHISILSTEHPLGKYFKTMINRAWKLHNKHSRKGIVDKETKKENEKKWMLNHPNTRINK